MLISLTLVEENVKSGKLTASKKSADFKCPSRSATPVLMLSIPALNVKFTVEKSSPSVVAVAEKSPKVPVT